MDDYPPSFTSHNLPLLVVSGLTQETDSSETPFLEDRGFQLTSDVPILETEDSRELLKHFRSYDASNIPWHGRTDNHHRFRVRTTGRVYRLPPRYAEPPAESPNAHAGLHSPLSPLTPSSPLFPDGLIDSRWINKHQEEIPSAYITVYPFTSNTQLSTLHDNKLKTDINNFKAVINKSGIRTRLVVVLLSEESIIQAPEIEDRLANIRKATGLDPKTSLFFLPPHSSAVELVAFAESVITANHPVCIEYYRDLSKHTRRKRNRGVIPPPTAPPTTGTSQTLSSQGWNVRYDFKLGIFAEFRQEMDVAMRSFEGCYEGLLGNDVFESIASWSPRWNEARMLADIVVIRIIRCMLWNGHATAASARWRSHREVMRDLVDRRGKGSSTYGWEAWESRWATVMGEIVQKMELPAFSRSSNGALFIFHEKTTPLETTNPWNYLHHPGYWFKEASIHAYRRQVLAHAIPEEDRVSPDASSASQLARRGQMYDTYMCHEPNIEGSLDHSISLQSLLDKAIAEYDVRSQTRMVEDLRLQKGKVSLKSGHFDDALRTLQTLWNGMTFRRDGWSDLAEEVLWTLRVAAARAGKIDIVITADWELLNSAFTQRANWKYDLGASLGSIDTSPHPSIRLSSGDVRSFLEAQYAFKTAEGRVGEPCSSQIVVRSYARPASLPVVMMKLEIIFEGNCKPVLLEHEDLPGTDDHATKNIHHRTVDLTDRDGYGGLVGKANLTFPAGATRIFEFVTSFKDAGAVRATSAVFTMTAEAFDLDYTQVFAHSGIPRGWWTRAKIPIRKGIGRLDPCTIDVLPKPPKVELKYHDGGEDFYTNESISIKLEIFNGEAEDVTARLKAALVGEQSPLVTLEVLSSTGTVIAQDRSNSTQNLDLGGISITQSVYVRINVPALTTSSTYQLRLDIDYNLASDQEISISCSRTISLAIMCPFEANYDFLPRIHPNHWPSYFNPDSVTEVDNEKVPNTQEAGTSNGLAQRWCLVTRYASFAAEVLNIHELLVEVVNVVGNIDCQVALEDATKEKTVTQISPNTTGEALFRVDTQTSSLDDRRAGSLEMSLAIKWSRHDDSEINTTVLPMPRFLVASSEPRVLAAVMKAESINTTTIILEYTIENPSMHFLTFGLSMDPSETFAFSGPKQTSVQLLPLSRVTVRFVLLPSVAGDWIQPNFVVKDRYFQKILKVIATEGMKVDKKGILVWVPPINDA